MPQHGRKPTAPSAADLPGAPSAPATATTDPRLAFAERVQDLQNETSRAYLQEQCAMNRRIHAKVDRGLDLNVWLGQRSGHVAIKTTNEPLTISRSIWTAANRSGPQRCLPNCSTSPMTPWPTG